ncbi:MAG: mannose-1-phosphate guanylyltransferase [Verrucomicrobiales bacterium]
MQKAFVLGAGLGTRLKPLTATLPKPLIPFFQRPLITFAFDHLIDLGIREFIVNTHHLPDAYRSAFPEERYRDCSITFRHEPVLLETAGGIGNVADLLGDGTCIVYNGDILTDLSLHSAFKAHRKSNNAVTLVLRSTGDARHIAWDSQTGKVTDIRNHLETGDSGSLQFTGIYFIEPSFVKKIAPGVKKSVIPHFLDLIRDNQQLGGVVADDGDWWDLGDRESYLQAHAAALNCKSFPNYAEAASESAWKQLIHANAQVAADAIAERSAVGAGAIIESGATVRDSVIWPGACVAAGAQLDRCIVRSGETARGTLRDIDV